MRNLFHSNALLLLVYGCLMICLASWFVFRESYVLHELHNQLPLLFLVRFSLFWLVSVLIAVTLFLLQLSYYSLFLKEPDKKLSQRAGFVAIGLGITGCTGVALLIYLYQEYPSYFYL
ncbi:hypothetical protein H7F15_15435 [Pontibacter sp. Tf4]|uniref:hypothetical protein n=1 Tax=Pontibacter sp. Tf4 TaxID=2761620 RepID=UPI001626B1CB|nr:hypothetical protein [Pontibacter sp. Tf4]MBB6612439.1 hypothetical protein [Pontibacter sp. Tf4]